MITPNPRHHKAKRIIDGGDEITPEAEAQVQALSLTQLETLGEALLDFSQPSDLRNWLDLQ